MVCGTIWISQKEGGINTRNHARITSDCSLDVIRIGIIIGLQLLKSPCISCCVRHNLYLSRAWLMTIIWQSLFRGNIFDHGILLKKIFMYCLSAIAVGWFRDYLSERTRSTMVRGVKSSAKYIACGIVQGSILNPFLFVIYINVLAYCLESWTLVRM